MKVFKTLAELQLAAGSKIGSSEWILVTQEHIRLFAQATGDDQWIHLDVERAKLGPYKQTIAHGFLTLSLLPCISAATYSVEEVSMGLNYGLNKVRFPAPLPAGSRVRGHIKLLTCEPIEGGAQLTTEVQIEMEGLTKPVCVAEMVSRLFVKAPS